MVYQEGEIRDKDIHTSLGEPIKTSVRGSGSYFIAEVTIDIDEDLKQLLVKSKVSFERYEKGILLRCFYRTQLLLIPISYNELRQLQYTNGEEQIRKYSLMWILLRLGVPMSTARFFALSSHYSITNAAIKLECKGASFFLQGPGSISSQPEFFELVQKDRLKVVPVAPEHVTSSE